MLSRDFLVHFLQSETIFKVIDFLLKCFFKIACAFSFIQFVHLLYYKRSPHHLSSFQSFISWCFFAQLQVFLGHIWCKICSQFIWKSCQVINSAWILLRYLWVTLKVSRSDAHLCRVIHHFEDCHCKMFLCVFKNCFELFFSH